MSLRYSISSSIVLALLIPACTRSIFNPIKTTAVSSPLSQSKNLVLTLTARNLSEDYNRLSTQDDELILLVYTKDSLDQLPTLIIQEYFILDTAQRSVTFALQDDDSTQGEFVIVLIEMDSKLTLAQIEPIVRLNLDKFQVGEDLQELLGDDDLLGVRRFPATDLTTARIKFDVRGRRLFDSFHYMLTIR